MEWILKKQDKIETLTSWIEATTEELEFADELCNILERSSSEAEFIEIAKAKLQEHKNPWLQDNLKTILALILNE